MVVSPPLSASSFFLATVALISVVPVSLLQLRLKTPTDIQLTRLNRYSRLTINIIGQGAII